VVATPCTAPDFLDTERDAMIVMRIPAKLNTEIGSS